MYNIGMSRFASARVVFDFPGAASVLPSLHRPRSLPRSFRVPYSIATPTRWPPRREFSIMAHPL